MQQLAKTPVWRNYDYISSEDIFKMTLYIIWIIVGLLSGVCASLGIGGGFILLIYLTAIVSTNQLEAQLINLVFFIPIAVISLFIHIRHRLVEKKIALTSIVSGTFGCVIGVFIATLLKPEFVSKIFAVFIFIIGVKQVFAKNKAR